VYPDSRDPAGGTATRPSIFPQCLLFPQLLLASISSCNCEHHIEMLYFHNTFQQIQKLAFYAAKSFQICPPDKAPPLDPTGGTAPDLQLIATILANVG